MLGLFRRSTVFFDCWPAGCFCGGSLPYLPRPFLETVTLSPPSGLSPILPDAMGTAGFVGTLLYFERAERPVLSDAGGYPFGHTAIAGTLLLAGRHPGSVAVPVKPVGPAGDGRTHRLVDVDCADAARGWRRAVV